MQIRSMSMSMMERRGASTQAPRHDVPLCIMIIPNDGPRTPPSRSSLAYQ